MVVDGRDTESDVRSPRGPSSIQVGPDQIRTLLEKGVDADEVARLLVATGCWSTSSASEIVSLLNNPSVTAPQQVTATAGDADWPGPIDEPGPLFLR
jgi:hypothetical protein